MSLRQCRSFNCVLQALTQCSRVCFLFVCLFVCFLFDSQNKVFCNNGMVATYRADKMRMKTLNKGKDERIIIYCI